MEIDKNLRLSLLLEVYGNLLTDKQKKFLSDCFDNNMSYSEIGEAYGITKQAAFDLTNRTVKILETYEEKLKLLEKFNSVKSQINEILENEKVTVEIKSKLNKILNLL